jgi:outer membrane protein OmpA-like peptidoglycan-associated protein
MARRKSKSSESNWIFFSDVMTGLMVIFMFIAISYISEVRKEQEQQNIVFEEFKATKDQLFSELKNTFKDDFKEWDMVLDNDLSIKFTNPEVLFQPAQVYIRPKFAAILDDFLPRYFEVLLQEKYRDRIAEIRIEGHTDNKPAYRYDDDPYIGNVILSQLRSAQVLKYFRRLPFYRNLNDDQEERLQFLTTANGLSYGRTLDANGELTVESNEEVNNKLSRRVEFRIITSTEALVEKVIKQLEK